MFAPAAFAFALSAHSIGIRITIHPDPVPVSAPAHRSPLPPGVSRAALAGRLLLRIAAHMIVSHANASPSTAAYQGYAEMPVLDNFKLPASASRVDPPTGQSEVSLCLQRASGRLEQRACSSR